MFEDQEDKNMFTFVIDWLTFTGLVWAISAAIGIGSFNIICFLGLILAILSPLGRAWVRSKRGSSSEEEPKDNQIIIKFEK